MDLATATNITSSNILSATNNHHNHNHPRDLSENQFVEKHESVIETKNKPLTFTNGVFKRHGSNPGGNVVTTALTNSNAAAAEIATKQRVAVATSTIYKECLKNHAASLGGYALDGCGEFMPSPNSSPANPTSLKCAACGCHRNFHRRDPDDPCPLVIQPPTTTTQVIEYQPLHRHHPPAPVISPSPASFRRHSPSPPSPPPISSSYYPSSAPQMLLALSSGGTQNPPLAKTPLVQIPAENSQNVSVFATTPVSNNNTMQMMTTATTPNGRKRFRTKFTSGQKEKMLDFAERVGWKMQKRDDEIVASLCKEIGVDRGVLKVWMHNNKSKSGDNHQINNRQQQQTHVLSNIIASATNVTNIVRTNNVHAVDNNALNMNHSVMHDNNLNNHNGGVIGGLQVNFRGDNGNNHDNDDEDDSDDDDEEDDDDTSPHHGANGSSSS